MLADLAVDCAAFTAVGAGFCSFLVTDKVSDIACDLAAIWADVICSCLFWLHWEWTDILTDLAAYILGIWPIPGVILNEFLLGFKLASWPARGFRIRAGAGRWV